MKIAYVANHDSGGNDDEGAICHALASLGHDVLKINERTGEKALLHNPDLVLFHKWQESTALKKFRCPRVFWYFDLVQSGDPKMVNRDQDRLDWMQEKMPLVDLGFCTDGDWVDRDDSRKLVHLNQGADSRVAGAGVPSTVCPTCNEPWEGVDLLFTGTRHGGILRESFVEEMSAAYAGFMHLDHGTYREALRDLIAGTKIVLAPDGPVTHRYWSNRIYNVLGFGGFLIHPWCETLSPQYVEDREVVYYRDRDELREKIDHYLLHPGERKVIQRAALERTLSDHTYTHRCASMMKTIKERLF